MARRRLCGLTASMIGAIVLLILSSSSGASRATPLTLMRVIYPKEQRGRSHTAFALRSGGGHILTLTDRDQPVDVEVEITHGTLGQLFRAARTQPDKPLPIEDQLQIHKQAQGWSHGFRASEMPLLELSGGRQARELRSLESKTDPRVTIAVRDALLAQAAPHATAGVGECVALRGASGVNDQCADGFAATIAGQIASRNAPFGRVRLDAMRRVFQPYVGGPVTNEHGKVVGQIAARGDGEKGVEILLIDPLVRALLR